MAASRQQLDKTHMDILQMQQPTQLLKFGRGGKPGFRIFLLSPDCTYLSWQSKNKAAFKTRVDVSDMKEMRFGQRTEKFRKNNRPDLENLSFSIIYADANNPNETLDLVCKDEEEFQRWTTTLQGLMDNSIDLSRYKGTPGSAAAAQAAAGASKNRNNKGVISKDEAFQGSNDVYTFGWAEWGQSGLAAPAGDAPVVANAPKLLDALLGKGVIGAACGWSHTGVITESGSVFMFGNSVGTGLPGDFFSPAPIQIPAGTQIVSLAAGAFHTAALTSSGQVLTWGCNQNGQLGHKDTVDRNEPTLVEALEVNPAGKDIFISDIVCGSNSSAALGDDGAVYTWGCGDNGQLGHNSTDDVLEPTIIKDLFGTDISKLAAGDSHMFACTDRETFAWGWNGCGQLGLGHEEDQLRPHIVESLRGQQVLDVSCGAAHTFALVLMAKFQTRVVYSWGSNTAGQLGQGKKKKLLKPFPCQSLSGLNIAEMSCGALHTIIRTEEGAVWTSGSNKHGQLGHGNQTDCDQFTEVVALKGKSARLIVAGGQHSAALVARMWVEDSEAKECMGCRAAFTFVNRKHHCRNCGGIFCNSCSSRKIPILKYGLVEPQRVCGSCYTKLGGK